MPKRQEVSIPQPDDPIESMCKSAGSADSALPIFGQRPNTTVCDGSLCSLSHICLTAFECGAQSIHALVELSTRHVPRTSPMWPSVSLSGCGASSESTADTQVIKWIWGVELTRGFQVSCL